MQAAAPAAPGVTPPPSPPSTVPWWAHVLIGFGLIVTGIVLTHTGDASEGMTAVGAGLAFLGVGSGVAASA